MMAGATADPGAMQLVRPSWITERLRPKELTLACAVPIADKGRERLRGCYPEP